VKGLQSRIFCKKGNSPDRKAGISAKMSIRRFSLTIFQENLRFQRCAKPDFFKCGFAEMQHASGKKLWVCAAFHTPLSVRFWQVESFNRHFFRIINSRTASSVIFPGILAFGMIIRMFFAEK
jgi:hypothetical protein